jgi:hypothetical protein
MDEQGPTADAADAEASTSVDELTVLQQSRAGQQPSGSCPGERRGELKRAAADAEYRALTSASRHERMFG